MVEKATELGVDEIVPVEAARSERGLESAAGKRVERWRKIAREAASNPGARTFPKSPSRCRWPRRSARPGYFLDEEGGQPLAAALPAGARAYRATACAILIGPEGGWTDAERRLARGPAGRRSGWGRLSCAPKPRPSRQPPS